MGATAAGIGGTTGVTDAAGTAMGFVIAAGVGATLTVGVDGFSSPDGMFMLGSVGIRLPGDGSGGGVLAVATAAFRTLLATVVVDGGAAGAIILSVAAGSKLLATVVVPEDVVATIGVGGVVGAGGAGSELLETVTVVAGAASGAEMAAGNKLFATVMVAGEGVAGGGGAGTKVVVVVPDDDDDGGVVGGGAKAPGLMPAVVNVLAMAAATAGEATVAGSETFGTVMVAALATTGAGAGAGAIWRVGRINLETAPKSETIMTI